LDRYKKNRALSKILLATKAMQKWTNPRENKKRREEVRLTVGSGLLNIQHASVALNVWADEEEIEQEDEEGCGPSPTVNRAEGG
jgi:hypothetical protein